MIEVHQEKNLDHCPYCGHGDHAIQKVKELTDNGVGNSFYIYMCYCFRCEQEWTEPYLDDDMADYYE